MVTKDQVIIVFGTIGIEFITSILKTGSKQQRLTNFVEAERKLLNKERNKLKKMLREKNFYCSNLLNLIYIWILFSSDIKKDWHLKNE